MNIRRTQLTASLRHKQRRRVSESTVRRERGLLQAIFERAIEEGHEIRNPFRGIDPKSNIDWVRGTVHVLGRFAKERDVPMQPDAKAALKEQLDAEGKLWAQNQQVKIPVAPRPGANVIPMPARRTEEAS
jgi:site-specific recombinase XerD